MQIKNFQTSYIYSCRIVLHSSNALHLLCLIQLFCALVICTVYLCMCSLWCGLLGQFQCGNKRCDKQEGLKSWEVNFAYVEHGEKRNALVKLSK